MRMLNAMGVAAALCAAAAMSPAARAQEAFDACELFTQEDAEKALGTTAAAEPVNPKVKRPKVIPACTYNGFKDGKAVFFFQDKAKFKARYATLGFNDTATLDEGELWPTSYALKEMTPAAEARIGALVKKAAR